MSKKLTEDKPYRLNPKESLLKRARCWIIIKLFEGTVLKVGDLTKLKTSVYTSETLPTMHYQAYTAIFDATASRKMSNLKLKLIKFIMKLI